MFSQRILVRPRYDTHGMLVYSAICGVACGFLYYPLVRLISFFTNAAVLYFGFPGRLVWLLLVLQPLLLPLAVALPLAVLSARKCQRPGPVFLMGQSFGAFFLLGYQGLSWYLHPFRGPFLHWISLLLIMLVAVLVGALFGLANLVLRQFMIMMRGRIVEQDGTLCWHCGYIVGRPPQSERCPECGGPTTTRRPERRSIIKDLRDFGRKRARLVGLIVFGALLIAAGRQFLRHQSPVVSMLAGISGVSELFHGPMMKTGTRNGALTLVGGWEATGVVRPIDGDPVRVLTICYVAQPGPEQPSMQIQLMAKVPGAPSEMGQPGDPVVLVNLDAAQATFVKDFGVPESLTKAIIEAADQAGWSQTFPAPNTFGQFIIVDPSSHFPALEPGE